MKRTCCDCRYRTAKLLHTVAQRLQKHTARHGAFQAWNTCLNHLLALARAHMDSLMLDNFLAAIAKCDDADSRRSLKVAPPSLNSACIEQYYGDHYIFPGLLTLMVGRLPQHFIFYARMSVLAVP
jgi:hypothetical protein